MFPMIFATLGPAGTNHELVLGRYVAARALKHARVRLFDVFEPAFESLLAGQVDFVLQCTAHPAHGECVGRYMHRVFPVDTFIAKSKPLAVLARAEVVRPTTIGLQPATRYYTDLSAWAELIEEPSTVSVGEGLLQGRFDAGICARELLDQHPTRLRLLESLGPALDAWVLFGRRELDGDLIVWPEAPVLRQLVE